MTWEELNAIIQRHGGVVSEPVVLDPEIDNPSPNAAERARNPRVPNPNPTRRYNLDDGKYFTARAVEPEKGVGPGGSTWQIIDPGNAVQPLTPADRLPSPTSQLEKIDAQGNVIPPGSSTPAAKLRDPSTGAVIDLPDAKTAAPEGTLKEFGNDLLLIKPDGSYSVVASKTADKTQQGVATFDGPDGARYEFDPNKPEGSRLSKLIDAPPDKTVPTTKEVNGRQFQWDPTAGVWKEAPGLPSTARPTTASTNTSARWIVFYDDQGNEVGRQQNPNYQAPTPTQLSVDTVSPNVPLLKADGTIQWVPNQNRVPAGQAMQALLGQLGVAVDGQTMSMDDAKNMLTGAVNILNAHTQAAQSSLSAIAQGAQTGAGLLQNRVSQATSTLQGLSGQFAQSKAMTAPAGLGGELVSGLQNWTTQLGGGQGVYDAAANMIQRADPTNRLGADAATAHAALSQMLSQYQQMTGQMHPLAQQATPAQGSFTAPFATTAQQIPQVGAAPLTVTRPGAVANSPNLSAGGLGPVAGSFTAPQTQPTVVLNFH